MKETTTSKMFFLSSRKIKNYLQQAQSKRILSIEKFANLNQISLNMECDELIEKL